MGKFKERDGLKYIMEQRLDAGSANQFPSDLEDCVERFIKMEDMLNKDYHPYVNQGATANGAGILTDHGPEHVQMVMRMARDIIGDKYHELVGYEIFILLVAIHFHDLGNIYGRDGHEQRITDVMDKMGATLPLNSIDRKFVIDIAMAHGGYAVGTKTDKDTIRTLETKNARSSVQVRPSLLAAILRFADELADDFSRSFANKLDVPADNEIYHAYSDALASISIIGNTVSLHYMIAYDHTQRKMLKNGDEVYLYDEIIHRLEKCLRELEYCRKYSDSFILITTLSVKIHLMRNGKRPELIDEFRLRLRGYPNELKLSSFIEQAEVGNTVPIGSGLKYSSGEDLKVKMDERATI